MKKSLIALAAIAIVSGASAQSSVTVFGLLDVGVSYYQATSSFYNKIPFVPAIIAAPGDVTSSKWAMSTANYAGSRIGFRGTEDLGGGLAASFWLEAGIANDTGTGTAVGGAFNFNRRSTVSITSVLGELRLGRDYTPTYLSDVKFDPFGFSGVGGTMISVIGSNLAIARGPGSTQSTSDNYARTSNSIGYFLPPNLGGFYGQLIYALPEQTKTSNVPDSPSSKGQYFGGRFGYSNGPFDLTISYGSSQALDQTVGVLPLNNKLVQTSFGGTYDFGPVKAFAEIAQFQDRFAVANARLINKYNGGLIGFSVPIGVSEIRGAYSRVNFENGLKGTSPFAGDASTEKLALGYVYNLSKRTMLFATIAKIKIDDGQNNPAVMGAVTGGGLSYISTGAGVRGYAPSSSMGYDFSIKHIF